MNKRWQISFNGGALWATVRPLNGSKLAISEERDLGAGQAFYRRVINTAIRFGKSDYPQFLAIERNQSQRCNEILIRVELRCAFTWQEYWRGTFSTGSGKFELANCVFEVKPQTVDAYTCILAHQSIKRNLLNAERVNVNVYAIPNLEFGTCTTVGFTPPPGDCDAFFGPGGGPGDPLIDGWDAATTSQVAPGPSQVNFYWRERIETECVGGNPAPPPGVGWTVLENNCATTGRAVYVRQPVISWPFDPPEPGTVVDGVNTPPDDTCPWVFMGMGGIEDPFTPGTDPVPYYVCISSATPTEIDTGRRLDAALQVLVDAMDCGITSVRSDFLGIDPQGDSPGYVAGENYVTGRPTQTEDLIMVQKSDAIDPGASNPATIGEMHFKDFMKMLNVMFKLFWAIDTRGRLRIEHWKYWTYPVGMDITTANNRIEPLTYQHLAEAVPNVERAQWMEAQLRDFVGMDIVYSGPCVNVAGEKQEEEYSPGKITTDITYILSDPDAISKDGFVVLATVDTGSYDTIIDTGAITGNFIANAPLSWANLMRDFWTWDRYLPQGNMNGSDVTFDGYRTNIEQEGVSLAICCDALEFDASHRITTELGELLGGIPAHVETARLDLHDNTLNLTLRYPY